MATSVRFAIFFALFVLAVNQFVLAVSSYSFVYTEYLKQRFNDTFHDHCDKYSFVQRFSNLIENPSGKYIMFVMQEHGLRNGGLGDRLAGLISAVTFSVRFNRTLVIRSENNFHTLFRPFHPTDILETKPKYTWGNWMTWSGYNMAWANHDETEYDMWECINNNGIKSDHCSMEGGDVSTPTILLRSNRCYLCRYDLHHGNGVGFRDLREELQISATEDLYKVAGCMLRLAFWPTEELWKDVDAYYSTFGKEFGLSVADDLKRQSQSRRYLRHADPVVGLQLPSSKLPMIPTRQLQNTTVSSKFNHTGKPYPVPTTSSAGKAPAGSNQPHKHQHTNKISPFYQISMHFRCGDSSYRKNGDADACEFKKGSSPQSGTSYMQAGNPIRLAECAAETFRNHTQAMIADHRSILTPQRLQILFKQHQKSGQPLSFETVSKEGQLVLMYITSDSDYSSKQMMESVQYNVSAIAPSGCHIEVDSSTQCMELTATQWFVLAQSAHIVVQTLDDFAPVSAFSRYAGIYSLSSAVFRNGLHCSNVQSNSYLSRVQQGNWYC